MFGCPDDASKKPEDSNYTVAVLTRCVVNGDGNAKKTVKIVPLEEPGEPFVISVSLSQVKCLMLSCFSFFFNLLPLFLWKLHSDISGGSLFFNSIHALKL